MTKTATKTKKNAARKKAIATRKTTSSRKPRPKSAPCLTMAVPTLRAGAEYPRGTIALHMLMELARQHIEQDGEEADDVVVDAYTWFTKKWPKRSTTTVTGEKRTNAGLSQALNHIRWKRQEEYYCQLLVQSLGIL